VNGLRIAAERCIGSIIEGDRIVSGISDRHQEIARRRRRKKKLAVLSRKLKKATASEKVVIGEKLRKMTLGADVIIKNWNLAER
jgi:hypothetical protein